MRQPNGTPEPRLPRSFLRETSFARRHFGDVWWAFSWLVAGGTGCAPVHEPAAPLPEPPTVVAAAEEPPPESVQPAPPAPTPPPLPPRDRDGDGVPDDLDACPVVPGVKTAEARTNGCPPGPALKGCRAILSTVFAFDPDSVEVKGSTASFLADLIRGLAASPHITLVGIEGFANAKERLPRQLSERRARVIRDALVAAGVDPARLKIRASGVGKPQTICGGCSCEEAANRVVEFVVLRRTDDLPTGHFSSDLPGKR